jgi:drug/metabolite transporter (DMT)-like permease
MRSISGIIVGLVATDLVAQISFQKSIDEGRTGLLLLGLLLYLGFGVCNYFLLKHATLMDSTMMQYGSEALVMCCVFLYSRLALRETYTATQWVGIALGVTSLVVLLLGRKRG